MPVIRSTYRAPFLLRNPHFNTIYTNMVKVETPAYRRERIKTSDGDFFDIDVLSANATAVVLVIHGLEGNSFSNYMKSMALAIHRQGWDVALMNMRGCSGEPNRLYGSYHSGKTDDADAAMHYLVNINGYRKVYLLGFSLGGNIVLKYAGEKGMDMPAEIKAVAAVSAPCDLRAAAYYLKNISGRIYLKRLIGALKAKAKVKSERFPSKLDQAVLRKVKDFKDFDDLYTAPAHGFTNAEEYWRLNSSRQFIPNISIPAFLINALDDPFLAPECYPFAEAEASENFFFEAPEHGGHVGFAMSYNRREALYHELRVLEFFKHFHQEFSAENSGMLRGSNALPGGWARA